MIGTVLASEPEPIVGSKWVKCGKCGKLALDQWSDYPTNNGGCYLFWDLATGAGGRWTRLSRLQTTTMSNMNNSNVFAMRGWMNGSTDAMRWWWCRQSPRIALPQGSGGSAVITRTLTRTRAHPPAPCRLPPLLMLSRWPGPTRRRRSCACSHSCSVPAEGRGSSLLAHRLTRLADLWDRASTDVIALSKPCRPPRPRWVPGERRSRRNPIRRSHCTHCTLLPVHVPSPRVTRYEPESEPSWFRLDKSGTARERRENVRTI